LGTDLGVFVSNDGGASWSHDDGGLPDNITNALALDRGSGVTNLFAFTFGRGVWRVTLPGSGSPCTYSVSPNSATADAAGSINFVTVNTQPGCVWSAIVSSGSVQILPPASGAGPGRLYYRAVPNDFSTPRDPGTFLVQGNAVHVTGQPGADSPQGNDSIATAQRVQSLPYHGISFSQLTSDPSDPVHSCTGSRDFQTAWWSFSAPADGFVRASGHAIATDGSLFGDAGLVITAYPASAVSAQGELGCFVKPRQANVYSAEGGFSFAVKAGVTYYVEVSGTTPNAQIGYLTIAGATAPGSLTVSPVSANLGINGRQQFTAQTTNLLTPIVRWSISPLVGAIDTNGVYTAPATLSAPTSVQIKAVSIADGTVQATATVNLANAPVAIGAITNAASFIADAVSPGEMVTIFGNGLGPATLAPAQLAADGTVATTVAQTQFFFDGVAAPIIYVQAGQSTVMVPYEVGGKSSTQVVASFQGQRSAAFTVPVTKSAPGVFTQDGKQGSILNANTDGTVTLNTTSARAAAGSTIEVYATGEGQTSPGGVDGVLNNGPVLPQPVLPVFVTIGGKTAQVTYSGAAPQGVAGFLQLNVVIPAGLAPGAQPLVVQIGTNMSPSIVTVWVK
jgi:uncharacterized protein (TIGR03437 family)